MLYKRDDYYFVKRIKLAMFPERCTSEALSMAIHDKKIPSVFRARIGLTIARLLVKHKKKTILGRLFWPSVRL